MVHLESSWHNALAAEFEKPYFTHLRARIRQEYAQYGPIYPEGKYIFRALNLCPLEQVRVVILGQDPYHGAGQAEGLSFSVPPGVAVPPSLVNIKQEIASDLGRVSIIEGGHLIPWVEQGVLLLNTTLTVRAHQAHSHRGLGWKTFTDEVIRQLSLRRSGLVFMLWGSSARRKGSMIDHSKHLVLEAPHPSRLSAYRGFFGCKHFSQANDYLISQGLPPIRW